MLDLILFRTSISDALYGIYLNGIYYYVWATITCLMFILCDAICAWRTVVLWNNDKRIIAVLAFFILGTIGTAGWSLVFGIIEGASPAAEGSLSSVKIEAILVAPTLCTNILSTGLIAWKAWQRRIRVREHLCEGKESLRVDRVFSLLIKSGLIYCCIWVCTSRSVDARRRVHFTIAAFILVCDGWPVARSRL